MSAQFQPTVFQRMHIIRSGGRQLGLITWNKRVALDCVRAPGASERALRAPRARVDERHSSSTSSLRPVMNASAATGRAVPLTRIVLVDVDQCLSRSTVQRRSALHLLFGRAVVVLTQGGGGGCGDCWCDAGRVTECRHGPPDASRGDGVITRLRNQWCSSPATVCWRVGYSDHDRLTTILTTMTHIHGVDRARIQFVRLENTTPLRAFNDSSSSSSDIDVRSPLSVDSPPLPSSSLTHSLCHSALKTRMLQILLFLLLNCFRGLGLGHDLPW